MAVTDFTPNVSVDGSGRIKRALPDVLASLAHAADHVRLNDVASGSGLVLLDFVTYEDLTEYQATYRACATCSNLKELFASPTTVCCRGANPLAWEVILMRALQVPTRIEEQQIGHGRDVMPKRQDHARKRVAVLNWFYKLTVEERTHRLAAAHALLRLLPADEDPLMAIIDWWRGIYDERLGKYHTKHSRP